LGNRICSRQAQITQLSFNIQERPVLVKPFINRCLEGAQSPESKMVVQNPSAKQSTTGTTLSVDAIKKEMGI